MEIKCKRFGCAYHEGTERLSIASCKAKTIEIDQYGHCKTKVDYGFTKKMEILNSNVQLKVETIQPCPDCGGEVEKNSCGYTCLECQTNFCKHELGFGTTESRGN